MDLTDYIREYFEKRNWVERTCTSCKKSFLVKKNMLLDKCGSQKAGCSDFEFLSLRRKNKLYTSNEIVSFGSQYFLQKNYSIENAIPIISQYGHNLFVGTAGQHFDDYIYDDRPSKTKVFFTAQPVIRLQSKAVVGKSQGFSTSFVNISTEHLNSNIDEHLSHLEDWFSFTSELGIYTGNVTLQIKKDSPKWGVGSFFGVAIAVYYRGVEIGYANYFTDVPTRMSGKITISDVSFGLERILWATNKTPSYLQGIGPLNVSYKLVRHKFMDSIRTAVLMSASGIDPSHKDRGSKLRDLFKDFTRINKGFPETLVRYYYCWWSKFLDFEFSEREVMRRVRNEWSRQINLILQKELKSPNSIELNLEPEDYINSLIERGIALEKIISVMEKYEKK